MTEAAVITIGASEFAVKGSEGDYTYGKTKGRMGPWAIVSEIGGVPHYVGSNLPTMAAAKREALQRRAMAADRARREAEAADAIMAPVRATLTAALVPHVVEAYVAYRKAKGGENREAAYSEYFGAREAAVTALKAVGGNRQDFIEALKAATN